MKPWIFIALTANRLIMELVAPAQARIWPRLWGHLRTRESMGARDRRDVVARAEVCEPMTVNSLPSALRKAFDSLQEQHSELPAGIALKAHLGLSHSHVGLMQLDMMTQARLTASGRDSLVHAWVGQMWSLQPDAQIVRWQREGRSHQILVSCISHDIWSCLDELSRDHGLRFESCLPAVLQVIGSLALSNEHGVKSRFPDTGNKSTTIVWSDALATGPREPVVQLMRFDGSNLLASWRGWLNQPSADEADSAVVGALRRFLAFSDAAKADRVVHCRWSGSMPSVLGQLVEPSEVGNANGSSQGSSKMMGAHEA